MQSLSIGQINLFNTKIDWIFSSIVICFKDVFICGILVVLALVVVVLPISRLSRQEEMIKVNLIRMYQQLAAKQQMTDKTRKVYLTIWKSIIQPKRNKFMVIKIHLITNVTPFLVFLSLFNFLEILLKFSGWSFFLNTQTHTMIPTPQSILILLRLIQETLTLKIACEILKTFKAYKPFIPVNYRLKFVKYLCFISFMNSQSSGYWLSQTIGIPCYCILVFWIYLIFVFNPGFKKIHFLVKVSHLLTKIVN